MSLLVAVKSVTPTIDPLNNTKTLIHVDRTAVNAIEESKNIMGEALSSSLLEGTSILKVTLDFDASPTNNGVFIVPSRNNYFGRGFALSPYQLRNLLSIVQLIIQQELIFYHHVLKNIANKTIQRTLPQLPRLSSVKCAWINGHHFI